MSTIPSTREVVQLSVRVTAAEAARLTELAGGPGNLSTYLRRMIFMASGLHAEGAAAERKNGRPKKIA